MALSTESKGVVIFGVKATYVFILVIMLLLLAGGVLVASFGKLNEDISGKRTYSAEGSAKRKVVLDTARVTLGVDIEGATSNEIQKEATEKYNAAVEAIKQAGIPEEDIQTQNYTISPKYERSTGKPDGYQIQLSLIVTVRDTDPRSEQVSKVINAGSNSGFNLVRGLNFYLDDAQAVQDELKAEAIEDAKARAERDASVAGLKLGKILNVYSGNYYPYYDYEYRGMGVADSASAPKEEPMPDIQIQPGQTEVEVSVRVEYELR